MFFLLSKVRYILFSIVIFVKKQIIIIKTNTKANKYFLAHFVFILHYLIIFE